MTSYSDGLGSIVIGNEAFILQGGTFYKLNLNSLTRTNLQTLSTSYRNGKGAMVYDGTNYIYFWGGWDISVVPSHPASNELWRYDISLNSWYLLSLTPSRLTYQSGVYLYPYIYFGGGGGQYAGNNTIFTYNLLTNTWGNIPNPSVGQGEGYFSENGNLYCIEGGSAYYLYQYDFINAVWNTVSLNNQNWQLFVNGPYDISFLPSTYAYKKVFPIGNNNFLVTQDGDFGCSSFYGCSGNVPHLLSLSLKRQEHVIVDSTECFNSSMDSVMIYYRLQFTGSYSNTDNYIDRIIGASTVNIKDFNNFFSTGTQILNLQKLIPSIGLNDAIRGLNIQASDSVYSNKYPINKTIKYAVTDSIYSSSNTNVCVGTPIGIVLNVTNSPGRLWQWYFNGNPLVGQTNYNYTATLVGTYYCRIIATSGCITYTNPVIIQTVALPTATIAAVTPTSFCQGNNVVLNANTGSGLTYQWKKNGVIIPGATSSSYTATTSGNYLVIVSNSASCSTISATLTVTVQPLPIVTASSSPSSATVCVGGSVTLTGSGATSYAWSGGISNGTAFIPASTLTYTVTGTDANGCVNTVTRLVTVNALPSVTASSTPSPATVCAGGSVTLTGSGATSYVWSGGISNGTSFIPASTLTYTVTGTDANGCVNTANQLVSVNSLPNVMLNLNADTVCLSTPPFILSGGTPIGGTYTGPGVTLGSFNSSTSGLGLQLITYSYTDGNSCTNTNSDQIFVDLCTGISTTENAIDFLVYPNPASETIMIEINNSITTFFELRITDVLGQIVYAEPMEKNSNHLIKQIDVSSYAKGFYSITIEYNNQKVVKKLILN